MQKVYSFFILVLMFNTAYGQRIYGHVFEQNSGSKPVADVEIAAIQSTVQTSDSNGAFLLEFRNIAPDKKVWISAMKEQWLVTNERDLLVEITGADTIYQLNIVMCRLDNFSTAIKDYYDLCNRYVSNYFDKKLNTIDRQKSGWQKETSVLYERLNVLQKELPDYAQFYACINEDNITPDERIAIRLFKDGLLDSSIAFRSKLASEKNLLINKELYRLSDSIKSFADNIVINAHREDSFHIRNIQEEARLAYFSFDFATAERKLTFLTQYDNANLNFVVDCAFFAEQLMQFDKAILYYQKAIKLSGDEPMKASLLINLGNAYYNKGKYIEAAKSYAQALDICTDLNAINPPANEETIALIQNNLGLLYTDQQKYKAAENAYFKALQSYKQLSISNQQAYEPKVAEVHNNLGDLYQGQNKFDEAEKSYRNALETYKWLDTNFSQVYEPFMASTNSNIGQSLLAQQKDSMAIKYFKEALTGYRKLAKENPQLYESLVATVLLYIAHADKNAIEFKETKAGLWEAMEIYRRLSINDPQDFEPAIAATLEAMGLLHMQAGKYNEAEGFLNEALSMYRILSITAADFKESVAREQQNLGLLYNLSDQPVKSESAYKAAILIYRKLSESNPEYITDLAELQVGLAEFFVRQKRATDAELAYKEAIAIYVKQNTKQPHKYDWELSLCQMYLGGFYFNAEWNSMAETAFTEALKLRRRLFRIDSARYEPGLTGTLMVLATYYNQVAKMEYAKNAAAEALQRLLHFIEAGQTEYNLDYCRAVLVQATILLPDYCSAKEKQTFMISFKKALEVVKQCAKSPMTSLVKRSLNDLKYKLEPDNVLNKIYIGQKMILQTNDYSKKVVLEQANVELAKVLVKEDPDRGIQLLGLEYGNLSWYLLFTKDFIAAEEAARAALFMDIEDKPLDYDSVVEWVNTNLAHALLFQGKYAEAEKIYLYLKNRSYNQGTYKETLLKDFDELEKERVTCPDVEKIRTLLRE